MLILAIFTTLVPYTGDCYTYWWANLLYINNLINNDDQVRYFQYQQLLRPIMKMTHFLETDL